MTLSMYQSSIPTFIHGLNNLAGILKKGEAYAEAKKIDPSVLVNARLFPDMFPLSRQVQIATDGVKGCAARLSGIEVPSFPDTESTFPELQERIAKTIRFLESVGEKVNNSEQKDIELKVGPNELKFKGQDYLFSFVIPNFYFHITAAYCILRENGVEVGKMDFLGKIQ